MHLDVDTDAVAGVADAVRQAATDLAGLVLPPPPPCEDLAAADAVGALLAVSQEHLDELAGTLRSAAVLLETARRDYCRAETRAVTRR